MNSILNINDYINASVHLGHTYQECNPKMSPYILNQKDYPSQLFDLIKTSKLLKIAGNIVQKKAQMGGKFLFVGTNKISSAIVKEQAKISGSFYINYRWLGGTLTNWATVKIQLQQLKHLEEQEKTGVFETYSKKQSSVQSKKLNKLRKLFNGIKEMAALPDIVIFTNQLKDALAIEECLRLGIPTICIVDTNCNPDLIPYPIPGNDDSSSSIKFILEYLTAKILKGYSLKYKIN